MRYICTSIVATLALAGTSFAATINVPGDYPTIQEAIDVVVAGDTISIAAGTYYESDIYLGSSIDNITITGDTTVDGYPAVTIDGQNGWSEILSLSGNSNVSIENLILTGGGGLYGALTIYNCTDAYVSNCVLQGNHGSVLGAGLLDGPNAILDNCVISGNSGQYGSIGVEWDEVATLIGCVIENNTGTVYTGGLASFGHVYLTNCSISNNTGAGAGGGVLVQPGDQASCSLTNTTVCGNSPDQISGDYTDNGGNYVGSLCLDADGILHVPEEYESIEVATALAIDGEQVMIAAGTYYERFLVERDITITGEVNEDGSPAVTIDGELAGRVVDCSGDVAFENLIITRGASFDGGGMSIVANATLHNCTITNSTSRIGGGLYVFDGGSAALTDCTITNNGAVYWQDPDTGRGGGIYCDNNSDVSLVNTLISGNSATWGGGICNSGYSTSTLTNCTVSNNIGKISGGGIYSVLSSASLSGTEFCSNSPTHIIGAWDDLGGNTFSDDCDSDPGLCGGDTNQDYNVDVLDMLYILEVWGTSNPAGDINEDGIVDVSDLLEVIGAWGPCP